MAIIEPHNITLCADSSDYHIVLKPLSDDHLPLLYKWMSDNAVTYYTESKMDLKYSKETVQRKHGGMSKEAYCFLIEVNGVSIGECWLQPMNRTDVKDMYPKNTDVRRIDMCIGEKDYWNKGIGTIFVGMLIDFAFSREKVDVLHCFCEDYNKRSERMWQKHGFHLVKKEKEEYNSICKSPIGKWQYHYVLSKEEYFKVTS